MKQKELKWNFTVPIVLAVVFVLLIASTFALFTNTISGTRRFTLSNFTSGVTVTFVDPTTSAVTTANPVASAGGGSYYTVSLNPAASNYLENLHVDVNFNGAGVGLIRVRLAEEWSKTASSVRTVYPYKSLMPYSIAGTAVYNTTTGGNQSAWYDNRANDLCFYYATPVVSTNARKIPLITGVDTSDLDFGAIKTDTVRILIKVDVVQVNRYPQYWGINTLPWNTQSVSASSATEVTNPGQAVS